MQICSLRASFFSDFKIGPDENYTARLSTNPTRIYITTYIVIGKDVCQVFDYSCTNYECCIQIIAVANEVEHEETH